ncbi:MAG TPA: HD domain-containing protein, partial [Promineifilum sp.]|nr:HD domain-containing protein [Promineifilum sp.]
MLSDWEPRFEQFIEHAMEETPDPAHDREHVRRVVANARQLAAAEGADPAVVVPAAWLHDCVVVPKDSVHRARASQMAAERAGAFLREAGYPAEYIPAIE